MPSKSAQKKFILAYLKTHPGTDVTDSEFHNLFFEKFGGNRAAYIYGACPVYKAQILLAEMYREGLIKRGIMGLSGHETGFPKWVYSYYL